MSSNPNNIIRSQLKSHEDIHSSHSEKSLFLYLQGQIAPHSSETTLTMNQMTTLIAREALKMIQSRVGTHLDSPNTTLGSDPTVYPRDSSTLINGPYIKGLMFRFVPLFLVVIFASNSIFKTSFGPKRDFRKKNITWRSASQREQRHELRSKIWDILKNKKPFRKILLHS